MNKYNEYYNKALEIFENDKSIDFKLVLNTFDLSDFEGKLHKEIDEAVDNQDKILNRIDLNIKILKKGF